MSLGERITKLREAAGISQQELAERLDVTRQTVAHWESGQSTPSSAKVVKMADLFDVTTDYLLRDAADNLLRDAADSAAPKAADVKNVRMEDARSLMADYRTAATMIATGVALCILGLAGIPLFKTLAREEAINMTDSQTNLAGGIVLLALVAVAVALFILGGVRISRHRDLYQNQLRMAPGVAIMISTDRKRTEHLRTASLVAGVFLCILSAVPILIGSFELASGLRTFGILSTTYPAVMCFLVILAAGVFLLVQSRIQAGTYDVLEQRGDHSPECKTFEQRFDGPYWFAVTAIYLILSFGTGQWTTTWIVFVLGAVVQRVLVQAMQSRDRGGRHA